MKRIIVLLALVAFTTGCGESPEFTVAGIRKSVHCIGGYEFAAVRSSSGSIALAQIIPQRECKE